MKFITAIAIIPILLIATGCSTTSNSVQYDSTPTNVINIQSASADGKYKVRVEDFRMSATAETSLLCRAMGEIDVAPGQSLEEFIKEALQEELLEAGVYSTTSPIIITGEINRVSFSSVSSHWDIAMTLSSSNGTQYDVSTNYKFKGSFDAWSACKNVANAFTPAVQDLLEIAISNPKFTTLIRNPELAELNQ